MNTTVGKALKVAVFLALSAGLGSLIIWAGSYNWGDLAWISPIINLVLVTLKNYFDKNVPNY